MKRNQNFYALIISVILLFGAILFRDKDLKDSAIELLYIVGMMMFNYGIAVIYRSLKKNNWNYSMAKNEYNYMFINTGVIVVTILFIIFLPSTYILIWIIPSAFLLFVLFIYDLIVNGLHWGRTTIKIYQKNCTTWPDVFLYQFFSMTWNTQ